jgi:hypothetical protein
VDGVALAGRVVGAVAGGELEGLAQAETRMALLQEAGGQTGARAQVAKSSGADVLRGALGLAADRVGDGGLERLPATDGLG